MKIRTFWDKCLICLTTVHFTIYWMPRLHLYAGVSSNEILSSAFNTKCKTISLSPNFIFKKKLTNFFWPQPIMFFSSLKSDNILNTKLIINGLSASFVVYYCILNIWMQSLWLYFIWIIFSWIQLMIFDFILYF